jgi:hypothetical protein
MKMARWCCVAHEEVRSLFINMELRYQEPFKEVQNDSCSHDVSADRLVVIGIWR